MTAVDAAHTVLRGVVDIEQDLKAFERDVTTASVVQGQVRDVAQRLVQTLQGVRLVKEQIQLISPAFLQSSDSETNTQPRTPEGPCDTATSGISPTSEEGSNSSFRHLSTGATSGGSF